MDRHLVVRSRNPWVGVSKSHAAQAGTGAPPRNAPAGYANDVEYTSLCGRRHFIATTGTFEELAEWEQCGRCAAIIERKEQQS